MSKHSRTERLNAFLQSPEFRDFWVSVENIAPEPGFFFGDSLVVWGRSLGFLRDPILRKGFDAAVAAYADPATRAVARDLIWRKHVLLWCARLALDVPGDFLECGVASGFGAEVIAGALDFRNLPKTYWLYDTFSGVPSSQADEGSPGSTGDADAALQAVRRKFAAYANVRIVPGALPDTLAAASPERIAFLHLDLNNATAELETLAILLPRFSVGAFIVLDDYGWARFGRQQAVEANLFEALGLPVLELPTGQGLVLITKRIEAVPTELVSRMREIEPPADLPSWPEPEVGVGIDEARWEELASAGEHLQKQVEAARAILHERTSATANRLPDNGYSGFEQAIDRASRFRFKRTDGGIEVSYARTAHLQRLDLVRALLQAEIDEMAVLLQDLAR